jgi:hypothetical protein
MILQGLHAGMSKVKLYLSSRASLSLNCCSESRMCYEQFLTLKDLVSCFDSSTELEYKRIGDILLDSSS